MATRPLRDCMLFYLVKKMEQRNVLIAGGRKRTVQEKGKGYGSLHWQCRTTVDGDCASEKLFFFRIAARWTDCGNPVRVWRHVGGKERARRWEGRKEDGGHIETEQDTPGEREGDWKGPVYRSGSNTMVVPSGAAAGASRACLSVSCLVCAACRVAGEDKRGRRRENKQQKGKAH